MEKDINNENTNGLIRQYIAKGRDFTAITEEDIKRIEDQLNNRPRKSLNYATPNEIFERKLQELLVIKDHLRH